MPLVMNSCSGTMKEGTGLLDKPIFFDTDCLSAFLWARKEDLLKQLYPYRIVIPEPVYVELDKPFIPHLKLSVDAIVASGFAKIQELDICSPEYETYFLLSEQPVENKKLIGHGEAAVIALAKHYGGIVASNNLRDVTSYISEYGLEHITTGDILVEAYQRHVITESDGNKIWEIMLAKKRKRVKRKAQ